MINAIVQANLTPFMEAHLHMWLNLLVRWAHFIVGIAWIGASFYFNWLENHLEREDQPEDTAGDLWAVHGGGFYYLRKFAVAPGQLPPTLHWFKWEAYFTWLTGMALLVIIFYTQPQIYLLNPDRSALPAWGAVGIGLASLVTSWVYYDLLCRSGLSRHEWLLALLIFAWFSLLTWLLSSMFGGRAAYIHVGAAMGTIMVANVLRVIIPGQKDLVRAVSENRPPDASKGRNALQRSRHNNYFTLPVLFIMLSGHFPVTYASANNWLVLLVFSVAAVLIRHYFNIRHLAGFRAWPLIPAALLLVALVIATAPAPRGTNMRGQPGTTVGTLQAYAIVRQRCVPCHAAKPTFAGFPAAPLGLKLDSPEKLKQHAEKVYQAAVITRNMPIGNLTRMTDGERITLADWYENRERAQAD